VSELALAWLFAAVPADRALAGWQPLDGGYGEAKDFFSEYHREFPLLSEVAGPAVP